ncbi:MAG TPA: hypothetical protein VGM00_10735, partial [Bradyrhizobium sp.]
MGFDELGEPAVERRQTAAAGDRLAGHLAHHRGGGGFGRQGEVGVGQGGGIGGLGKRQRIARGLAAQKAVDCLRLGGADFGGGDVAGQQQQRPGIGQVEGALEVRVDRI